MIKTYFSFENVSSQWKSLDMMPNSNYSSSTFWLGLNTEYSHVRLASVGRDVACISAAFLNSKSSRVRASHGAMMAVLSRSKSWSAPENQTNPGAKLIHSSSARGWKTYGSLRIILRPASTNTVKLWTVSAQPTICCTATACIKINKNNFASTSKV